MSTRVVCEEIDTEYWITNGHYTVSDSKFTCIVTEWPYKKGRLDRLKRKATLIASAPTMFDALVTASDSINTFLDCADGWSPFERERHLGGIQAVIQRAIKEATQNEN